MGICGSQLSQEDLEAIGKSRSIDEANMQDHAAEQDKIKMLLLGAGESGKSTIFKQMKILFGAGFTEEERLGYRRYVWGNVVESIKAICDACDRLGYTDEISNKGANDIIAATGLADELTPEVGKAIESLWSEPAVRRAWDRRSEFQVMETAPEFFAKVQEMARPDYCPETNDVLLARVRTTGIVEERYIIDDHTFVLFDVGGQRNERKKWIHCFDEVNAVIFVAAISEYDQVLFEDETQNRMIEAMNLFAETANSAWFEETSMILFLNKRDLFREKIGRVPIGHVREFADYSGADNSYDDGVAYFTAKFEDLKSNAENPVYTHVTCATDTKNVEFVFNSCKSIIMSDNLDDNGFMG